jgi:hypothetical protein
VSPTGGTPIDRNKLLSLSVVSRRGDIRVREWCSDDGERHKATTDEAGTVTQHARGDRQDVLITPQVVRTTMSREVLDGRA